MTDAKQTKEREWNFTKSGDGGFLLGLTVFVESLKYGESISVREVLPEPQPASGDDKCFHGTFNDEYVLGLQDDVEALEKKVKELEKERDELKENAADWGDSFCKAAEVQIELKKENAAHQLHIANLSELLRRCFRWAKNREPSVACEKIAELSEKCQHLLTPVSPLRTTDEALKPFGGER